MRPPKLAAVLLAASLLTVASCSSDSSDDSSSDQTTTTAPGGEGDTTATTAPVERPDGPAADLSEELTGGKGVMLAAADQMAFEAPGYVEHEYAAAGTAVRYTAEGDLPTDGTWELTEGDTADYRTRIVVRRPEKPEDFNGTVVVEWLNVSGGLDANPDFTFMAEELLRGGYAWVGVSAQHIGIEGGPVAVGVAAGEGIAGKGLKVIDPDRYGDLSHPGDAFSYDIYTQIARALRADGASGVLGDLEPERLLAVGESQSGFALTTYANGVQPLAHQYDGILIRIAGRARRRHRHRRHHRRRSHHGSHRPRRAGADPADRGRRDRHPQLLPRPPGRHRADPTVGGGRRRPRRPVPGGPDRRHPGVPAARERRTTAVRGPSRSAGPGHLGPHR